MTRNFALAAGLLASILSASAAKEIPAPAAADRADAVQAVAYYFPDWTRPPGNKERVFAEWWYLENAVPRFPGHEQPKKPVWVDEKRLAEIGNEGVDVLICDSTNVLREGFSPSERDVADTLLEIVAHAKGRVAITTFASHVERVASAVRAARASGREVVLAGRAMRNTIEAARACGYLHDAGAFLDEDSFGYLPPNKIMLLCLK